VPSFPEAEAADSTLWFQRAPQTEILLRKGRLQKWMASSFDFSFFSLLEAASPHWVRNARGEKGSKKSNQQSAVGIQPLGLLFSIPNRRRLLPE
jgi:hypothetical protein